MLCSVSCVTTYSSDNDTLMYCNTGIISFDKTIGPLEWKSMELCSMLLSVPLQFIELGTFPETSTPLWRWQCPLTFLLESVESFNPGENAVLYQWGRQWASSTKRNLDVQRNKNFFFILYDRNCPCQKTKPFSVRYTITLLQTHTCHFRLTSGKFNL